MKVKLSRNEAMHYISARVLWGALDAKNARQFVPKRLCVYSVRYKSARQKTRVCVNIRLSAYC